MYVVFAACVCWSLSCRLFVTQYDELLIGVVTAGMNEYAGQSPDDATLTSTLLLLLLLLLMTMMTICCLAVIIDVLHCPDVIQLTSCGDGQSWISSEREKIFVTGSSSAVSHW